jgi:hypothetical protein
LFPPEIILLRLFGRERFEKIPNRAPSALRFVEKDLSHHVDKLTCRLTTVKPGNFVCLRSLRSFLTAMAFGVHPAIIMFSEYESALIGKAA